MCRFIAYVGNPILLETVLVKPENSIINQSIHARESQHTLNGDGFGLGWYNHKIDPYPALFKSIQPAWNNSNLVHLASKIESSFFFAHVRAASRGGVDEINCHPFAFDNLLFMHNGTIHGFNKIKRPLRRLLDDDIYDWIKGQTDSEHFFALFLQTQRENKITLDSPENFAEILRLTLSHLQELLADNNADPLIYLNIVITDGTQAIACRYANDPEAEPNTLHYAVGEKFVYEHDAGHMYPVKHKPGSILISSEKLTDYDLEWHSVSANQFILIDNLFNLAVSAI